MKLVKKSNFYALESEADGVAILTFYKNEKISHVHSCRVVQGWNLLEDLGLVYAKADSVKMMLFRAAMAPGNMATGLQGSPIIPLSEAVSDQKELRSDEDDLGGELEPDKNCETPSKIIQVGPKTGNSNELDYKSADPFFFSQSAREKISQPK